MLGQNKGRRKRSHRRWGERMKIGELRMVKGFWKYKWDVFTGTEKKVMKFVRFNSFENAHIFSQLVKLNDRFRDNGE